MIGNLLIEASKTAGQKPILHGPNGWMYDPNKKLAIAPDGQTAPWQGQGDPTDDDLQELVSHWHMAGPPDRRAEHQDATVRAESRIMESTQRAAHGVQGGAKAADAPVRVKPNLQLPGTLGVKGGASTPILEPTGMEAIQQGASADQSLKPKGKYPTPDALGVTVRGAPKPPQTQLEKDMEAYQVAVNKNPGSPTSEVATAKTNFIRKYGFDPDKEPGKAAQIYGASITKEVADTIRPITALPDAIIRNLPPNLLMHEIVAAIHGPEAAKHLDEPINQLIAGTIAWPVDVALDGGVLLSENSTPKDRILAATNIILKLFPGKVIGLAAKPLAAAGEAAGNVIKGIDQKVTASIEARAAKKVGQLPDDIVLRDPALEAIHSPPDTPPTQTEKEFYRQGKPDKSGFFPNMKAKISEEASAAYQKFLDDADNTPIEIDVPGDGKFTLKPDYLPEFHKLVTGQPIKSTIEGKTYLVSQHGNYKGRAEMGSVDAPDVSFKTPGVPDELGRVKNKSNKGILLPDRPEFEGRQILASRIGGGVRIIDAQTGLSVVDSAQFFGKNADEMADKIAEVIRNSGKTLTEVTKDKPIVNPKPLVGAVDKSPKYLSEKPSSFLPEPGKTPKVPEPPEVTDPFAIKMETLDAAEKRIRETMGKNPKMSAGKQSGGSPILKDLIDHVSLFALKAMRAGAKFTHWAAEMVAKFGDGIKAHLENGWARAAEKVRNLNNTFGGGLSNLTKVSPESSLLAGFHADAGPFALAKFQQGRAAVDQIAGAGFHDVRLIPALVQARLTAVKARMGALANEVARMSDEEFLAFYNKAPDIEGASQGLNIADKVATMIKQGDIEGARTLFSETAEAAATKANDVLTPDEFNTIKSERNFKEALDAYKVSAQGGHDLVHGMHEGYFSKDNGEFDTYIPLVRTDRPSVPGTQKNAPYKSPTNVHNRFATGAGESYSTDVIDLQNSLVNSTKGATRSALMGKLKGEGLMREATDADVLAAKIHKGEPGALMMEYQGRMVPAVLQDASEFRTLIVNGKRIPFGAEKVVIPEVIAKELKPILESGRIELGLGGVINKLAVAGVAEPSWHEWNLVGVTSSHMPSPGKGIGKVLNFPGTKWANVIRDSMKIDFKEPGTWHDIAEMGKLGVIPTRWSQHFLEETSHNIAKIPQEFVFGKTGQDIRMRLLLYRDAQKHGLTPLETRKYVNALGTYTRGLDSNFERFLKDNNINPFATAGKTQLIGGVKALFGTTPGPKDIGSRAMRLLTGSGVAFAGQWAIGNKVASKARGENDGAGYFPWENPKKIPFGVLQITDDKRLDLAFTSPTASRGLTTVGVRGAYNTAQAEGTNDQMANAAFEDFINSSLHVAAGGPSTGFVTRALGGVEPRLSLLNDQGKVDVSMLPSTHSTGGFWEQRLANAESAIAGVNPTVEKVAEISGLHKPAEWQQKRNEGVPIVEQIAWSIFDTFFPRAHTEKQITEGQSKYLKRQAKGMENLRDGGTRTRRAREGRSR